MRAIKALLRRQLHRAPPSVLAPVLRRRPYLIPALPAGFDFTYRGYLDDLSIRVDPRNVIEFEMLSGYDSEIARTVQTFVRPGDHCVDVGANVGAVTLMLAKRVGPTGRVLAIEPGPPYCARLRANLALNPSVQRRVAVAQVGVSDRSGTLHWKADPAHPYNASLLYESGESVPVQTLDSLVAQHQMAPLRFIKIDVEGMELEVLRGSPQILRDQRPIIVFESMDLFREVRGFDIFAAIEELLRSFRYRLCDLAPDGQLREVASSKLPRNTIAVPES